MFFYFVFFLHFWGFSSPEVIQIDLRDTQDFLELPRFWTNTGFCPPAPINASSAFLLSPSVQQNLELVASVPNSGITHIRTHWILELIETMEADSPGWEIKFSFRNFDRFLDLLKRIHLVPHVEFMGNPGGVFTNKSRSEKKILWRDLTLQLLKHSIDVFGQDFVNSFRFETWNEPDLLHYNLLNFSLPEFIDYVSSIREGLMGIEDISPGLAAFKLRGPAGLFHRRESHELCYGMLEYCTTNTCPIDILTFHRKGSGRAEEILSGGVELLGNLTIEFPWISHMEVSNNEADLSSGWSHALPANTDVRYAAELTKTVLLHWDAKRRGILGNLETISHDNAFLSYHPYEFTQRTLLAHFRMNNTQPVYSEFIKKPVLGALTLLANLAKSSGSVQSAKNLMFMVSRGKDSPLYACVLLISSHNGTQRIRIKVKLPSGRHLVAFAEILDQKRSNPARIWKKNAHPPYPDHKLLLRMRKSQTPAILIPPQAVKVPEYVENFTAVAPFVVSLRFCENSTKNLPRRVENLRLNQISEHRVTILWNEDFQPARCVKNYQVYFKPTAGKKLRKSFRKWTEITHGWHIPDCSFDFWRPSGIAGVYRVRAVDILGRYGRFSKAALL